MSSEVNHQTDVVEDMKTAELTGRTMRVARRLAERDNGEFAKPGNLVEVRFVKGQSLSLTASRLLALMILTAGSDAWKDIPHRIRKADIRRGHNSNERISDMLEELHRTLFAQDDLSWRGKKTTHRFPLLANSKEEFSNIEGGWIEWEFSPDARKLIQESETYAVLNRQAVLGFKSAYALKLYEIGALRLHRRIPTWRTDLIELRSSLGIGLDTYKDFGQLKRSVLQRAKKEIDQLAHFTLEWKTVTQGKAVTHLEFTFVPKEAPAQYIRATELDKHSSGREARRDGKVEEIVGPAEGDSASKGSPEVQHKVVDLIQEAAKSLRSPDASPRPTDKFPQSSLRFAGEPKILSIARESGGGWDVDALAEDYRKMMGDRLEKLSGTKLENSWRGFCESFVNRRGRPQ